MKPRPPYKWKSFWLGLFVLVFLGWAWWDSTRFDSGVAVSRWTLNRAMGHIFLVEWPVVLSPTLKPYRHYLPAGTSAEAVSKSWVDWGGKPVGVPDIAVFSLFFFPWSAFLGWRWQRQRKHTA